MSLINNHVGPVALSSDTKYDFMRETHPCCLETGILETVRL